MCWVSVCVECVLEVIGAPSMLRLTCKAAALARVLPTFAFLGKRKDGKSL